jgi:hypothetical protein
MTEAPAARDDDGTSEHEPWRLPWKLLIKVALILLALVAAAMALGRFMLGLQLRAAMQQGVTLRGAVVPYYLDFGQFPPSLAHAGYRPRRGEPTPARVEQGYRLDVPRAKVRLYFVFVERKDGTEWTCITPDTDALVNEHPGCRYDPTFVRRPVAASDP